MEQLKEINNLLNEKRKKNDGLDFMENLIKLEKNILKNYLYDKVNNKRDLEYFIKLSK